MKNKKIFLLFTMCISCFCLAGCSVSTGTPIRISGGQVSQPVQMETVTIDTAALNQVFELAGKGEEIDLKEVEKITQSGVKQTSFEIVQHSTNNSLGGTNSKRNSNTVIKKDGFITIDIRTDNLQEFFDMYVK